MRFANERAQIVEYAKRLRPDRLVVGTSGNLSVRVGDHILATPSGLDYDALTPELVCVLDLSGNRVEASLDPTSEMPLHLSVYATTDHRAVVHTHATAATAASMLLPGSPSAVPGTPAGSPSAVPGTPAGPAELPAVHYLTALFGGPVRVAEYATYGSPELAAAVTKALSGRLGCLMANHGTVTVGASLAQAYQLNLYLEWLCEVWLRAVSAAPGTGRPPTELSPAEIDRVIAKLETYGQEPPK